MKDFIITRFKVLLLITVTTVVVALGCIGLDLLETIIPYGEWIVPVGCVALGVEIISRN